MEFALPITRLNFKKYFLDFEKLFNVFKNQPIYEHGHVDRNFFKNQLKCIAHKYFYNFKPYQSTSPIFNNEDHKVLQNLAKDSSIHITRPDKGRGVVILDKTDYIEKAEHILKDPTKFEKLIHTDAQKLTIKLEDKINNFLRKMKKTGTISEDFYNAMYSSGSTLSRLYGLPKIHKENAPLRPIVSTCTSHNYNLAKKVVDLLEKFSINDYSLKNSYDFTNAIQNVPDAQSLYMCSFDIESLYTNIPVKESIDIILNQIFNNDAAIYHGFKRNDFKNLLERALLDSYFSFNDVIYKQLDGLAMGSPLSPIIANIFLVNFEKHFLDDCPDDIKPMFYRRYLDDTFILFKCKLWVSF